MPIAQCHWNLERAPLPSGELVAAWAERSGADAAEMTINLAGLQAQHGRRYAAMAWLYLPTLWPEGRRRDLATSLAEVLAEAAGAAPSEVFVCLQLVEAGSVVEDGEVVTW